MTTDKMTVMVNERIESVETGIKVQLYCTGSNPMPMFW